MIAFTVLNYRNSEHSYQVPTCLLRDFSWSPGDNIIAFWVPEDKDIPARVTLMQMPSRQEIRVRNLFNVVDCKLHWQRNGDYLCVKVDRTPKGTQVRKWSERVKTSVSIM